MFRAIMLHKTESGATRARVESVDPANLPEGEIEIQVAYSTLNYKDGLAITGKAPVVRQWPMIPGIDLAGIVLHSASSRFAKGDEVIINGHGMGELHWGGLSERARVPVDWVTSLPPSLTLKDTMSIGTAGYTAMLSVLALESHGVLPGNGPVLVTGANGGVGSFSVALLAGRGYHVVASTGRTGAADRLKSLGAEEIIERSALSEPGKPLQKERWAGVVDCVGSYTLANACAQTRDGGIVTACGMAQGLDFVSTVAPFILRGVALVGINSVYVPEATRTIAWNCLASETDDKLRGEVARTVSLEQSIDLAKELVAGKVKGRIVVDLAA